MMASAIFATFRRSRGGLFEVETIGSPVEFLSRPFVPAVEQNGAISSELGVDSKILICFSVDPP